MHESEWENAKDPQVLLSYVGPKLSARKVRLFAIACCRMLDWQLSVFQKQALEVAERHADNRASDQEMEAALLKIMDDDSENLEELNPVWGHLARAVHAALFSKHYEHHFIDSAWLKRNKVLDPFTGGAFGSEYAYALYTAINVVHALHDYHEDSSASDPEAAYRRHFSSQAKLLRDIVGNPFWDIQDKVSSAVEGDPSILSIAAEIYADSRFELLGQLVLRLVNAGVPLRSKARRVQESRRIVRGFWVVDQALGFGWQSHASNRR